MLAASYWSLLEPALEMAGGLETYGAEGEWAFVPVSIGFFLGGVFVYGADILMDVLGVSSPVDLLKKDESKGDIYNSNQVYYEGEGGVRKRIKRKGSQDNEEGWREEDNAEENINPAQWRRILLLIVAITVHNIPEGLAVGVGFGAIGRTKSATFESARNLAIGIGIQNFPEGLSVSLPLKAAGFSNARAIWYGQLSGLVEPVAGVLGAALVTVIVPLLPYALSFAAGAMVYVVVDDIIPEAQSQGNGKAASWGVMAGFIIMMSLDVALG
ncbi:zinc transporter ZIP11 [Eurytemora carolleeae]|uniref:zinc transporter ZIP11 n=1 Tax=Eurytemora carolleeae TaxID=1294199 RepID=UPI000C781D79|nr:zinc transporter ZIP11 [Eurytemora carolleeae]XP_023328872.1 zinc transporter ZIP11 [Eurytemora carolleeae]XP_023328873.1 zinc transporter ZIP11 [Eurytemora carolleeae]XP_023328874.1 zinc transporter ZIP11 [Eurytemora carolleeae]|eukprot:XP_023328871.1 zinc transporter ZIP11-like [Eurytemora affinis]